MADITCAVNPRPEKRDADRMYVKVRQELHGLGADAYSREAARRLGMTYDDFRALRSTKGAAKKVVAPKPTVAKPPAVMEKATQTGKITYGDTTEFGGKQVLMDNVPIGRVRLVEITDPVMGRTNYSVGVTKRKRYRVKDVNGDTVSGAEFRTQAQAVDYLKAQAERKAKAAAEVPKVEPVKNVVGTPMSPDEATSVWKPYLDAAEQESIQTIEEYTISTFVPMNRVLRTGQQLTRFDKVSLDLGGESTMDLTGADIMKRIRFLRNTIEDAPTIPRDIKVYRGASDIEDVWHVGSVVTDRGFGSTSLKADTPVEMMEFTGGNMFLFEIDIPAGAKGLYLEPATACPDQYELLLQAGARYRVKGKRKVTARELAQRHDTYTVDGDVTLVELELIP